MTKNEGDKIQIKWSQALLDDLGDENPNVGTANGLFLKKVKVFIVDSEGNRKEV